MYFAYNQIQASGSYSRSFIFKALISASTLDWELYNCATVTSGEYDTNNVWATQGLTAAVNTNSGSSPSHSVSGSVSAVTNAL